MAFSPPALLRSVTLLALSAAAGCGTSPTDTSASVTPDAPSDTASDDRRLRHDADGDGYAKEPWGTDCDDTRKSVNPGATETCATAYDDDCDGVTDELNASACVEYYADADGDGYGDAADGACYCSASGAYVTQDDTDCDDASASIFPGATDIPGDGIDQDCDGADATSLPGGGTGGDTGGGSGGGTGDAPLYGFWGLNGYTSPSGFADVESRMGIDVFQSACSTPNWCVNTYLPEIRAAGMKATFRMTPDHDAYTTSGNFDLAKWKAQLLLWKDSGVQTYIDDGTLVGHMLLDDIHNFSGTNPTGAELDEMARYSKELFPGLMTYVRERATDMPVPTGGKYVYVDACVNQYMSKHGDVYAYASGEEAQALSLGLGVINGLNMADGGDGSSGQPGWRSGFWAMSAAEITEYGDALAAVPSMGMFLNWEYDGQEAWSDGSIGATYFNQPDLQAALYDLSVVVGSHAPVTLLKP